jgi:hypothetical protein
MSVIGPKAALIHRKLSYCKTLFDCLVCELEQFVRHGETKHPRGRQVDDQLELDWHLYGKAPPVNHTKRRR